jgi:hypothetical protein
MYAKLKNGVTIDKYPYTIKNLYDDNPNVTFGPITLDLLAKFNVVPVAASSVEYDIDSQYLEEIDPELIGSTWTQQWQVRNYDTQTTTARKAIRQAQREAEYITALEAHYDAKAREKRYDNRYTCALRAGYAGPFQAEGTAFAVWMDNCNALAYQILAEVLDNERETPTIDELIAEMPIMVWPN